MPVITGEQQDCKTKKLNIHTLEDLNERCVSSASVRRFGEVMDRLWYPPTFSLPNRRIK